MNHAKQILILVILVILTAVPLIPSADAAFTGDDQIIVVLDPGHGGNDPGAAGIRSEAYYNLEVALAAKAKLEADGNFKVYMTRSTAGESLTLAERLYYADTVNADVCISIHFNSSTSSSMGGVEVYGSVLDEFYLGTLGTKISSKVAEAAGIRNRGVFRKYDYGSTLYYWSEEYQWDIPGDSSVGGLSDYYGVITWGAKFGIPSLIIEHAYLSNRNEKNLIEDPAVLKAMGEADADALIEYYTNHTHSYGEETVDAPVTCFSAGKKSVHCTVCGHRKNVTTVADAPDPSKHIWLVDGTATAATCESDGYAKYYCRYTHNLNDKGCEQFEVHRKEEVTPAYGHDYQITLDRDVTHTVDGITTYECTRCSSSYSETVAAEGHSFTLTEHADPDCVTDGHDTYTCDECGEESVNVIPKLGHDFKVLDRVDPACEEDGSEHRICERCDFEETVTLPATGHEIVIYADIMPNCTEEGLRETKCSTCGKMEKEVKEKTGHSFEELSRLEPDCENSGESRNRCVVCAFEETVLLDALGHDFEIIAELKAATCESDGSIQKRCRTCGHEETETVPAIGHAFDGGTVVKEPGLLFGGSAEHVCSNDSAHKETRVLRDLTVFEYKDEHPARFTAACVIAFVIVVGVVAAAVIIVLKKRHKPAHAKAKSDAPADETAASEAEKETVE